MQPEEEFLNPGSWFRGKPFWAWNGKLDPVELRRQVRVLKRMGMGGGFMHSRVGLDTEYLGPEWFECVRTVLDECRKNDLEAWLYDEDRWPSGAAGGMVTKDPRHRQRHLRMDVLKAPPKESGNLIAVFRGTLERYFFRHDSRGRDFLAFSEAVEQPSPWYNGQTYLDTLSKEAVRSFIDNGYAPYMGDPALKREFGKRVPGIFTDEPNYGQYYRHAWLKHTRGVFTVPWTGQLIEEFKRRYGRDLVKHLPSVILKTDDPEDQIVRYCYHDLIAAQFVEAFAAQIGAWCKKRNLLLTGHVLEERTLKSQTGAVGSVMRFYEHMQAPGIDILTQFRIEYETAKQCASVLHQTGRKWMLSELYGCTGWHFSFEGHKHSGDWQAALGVNIRCQHLAWYTMQGEAKRDYPASIFFQSPWWKEYPVVEDYFARVSSQLSRGEPVRDVLVVHPLESQWLFPAAGGNAAAENSLQASMEQARNILLQNQVDFDYGDEEMMSRLCRVLAGQPPRLKLGKAVYSAVVVPPCLTLRKTTVAILTKFQRAGGKVIFLGKPAALVDAVPSPAVRNLALKCRNTPLKDAPIIEALDNERAVRLASHGKNVPGALIMLRQDGGDQILFIANTDRQNGYDPVRVTLRQPGAVEEWDPTTGKRSLVSRNAAVFDTTLHPSGSRLFVIRRKPSAGLALAQKLRVTRQHRLPGRAAPVQLSEPNAVVLDLPRFKIGKGSWQGPLEILKVDQLARAALGVPKRGGAMCQPWARPKIEGARKSKPVQLEYRFDVREIPGGALSLALETPGRFCAALNGVTLTADENSGWWVDPCLKLLSVPAGALRKGENRIELDIDYTEDDGLETCFLLGDFGVKLVKNRPVISAPVRTLKPGNWCGQGLPFYSGSVTYRFTTDLRPRGKERAFLSFEGHRSALIKVFVDGKPAGHAPWPPFEVEITNFARTGAEIAVEVFPGRRNAFGPLHLADSNPSWTGPAQFVTEGKDWRDAYHLHPYGLMKPPVLVYKRGSCKSLIQSLGDDALKAAPQ